MEEYSHSFANKYLDFNQFGIWRMLYLSIVLICSFYLREVGLLFNVGITIYHFAYERFDFLPFFFFCLFSLQLLEGDFSIKEINSLWWVANIFPQLFSCFIFLYGISLILIFIQFCVAFYLQLLQNIGYSPLLYNTWRLHA